MTPGRTSTKLSHRRVLIALAAIPTIDCFCNQLSNALQVSIGPLSLLQTIRGFLLVVFALIIMKSLLSDPSGIRRIPLPAVGAAGVLGLAASKELIVTGTLSISSIGAYGQMAYWVLLWTTVSILCSRREQGEIILRGLAWGACLTAVSVILGLFVGSVNYYKNDSVHSSAGWFDTAKMITGILVVGGIVILYLGRNSRGWLPCLAAGSCFTACVLTYARAGSVALVAVLLWFAIWRCVIARDGDGIWLNRFLLIMVCVCILVPVTVNTRRLLSRWNDVSDSDRGGSGRATFWKVAVDAYVAEDAQEQALGIGYSAMSDMLLLNYGDDIKHTHNDVLDLLLVGGFVGVLWLIGLTSAFAKCALSSSVRSVQGATGVAIVLTYLCHSQLTGQIWGTDAMTYYTLSLTCVMMGHGKSCAIEIIPIRTAHSREVVAQA
jgi:hypothetical protein